MKNQLKLLRNKCDLLFLIYFNCTGSCRLLILLLPRPPEALIRLLIRPQFSTAVCDSAKPFVDSCYPKKTRFIYIFYKISDLMRPLCTLHFMLRLLLFSFFCRRCCFYFFIFFYSVDGSG